jgi:hypothetical protein
MAGETTCDSDKVDEHRQRPFFVAVAVRRPATTRTVENP